MTEPGPGQPTPRRFRRLGIGVVLTLLLAGICILTAALVHESWQRTSDRNASDLVKEINNRIADTVAGNLQQVLTNATASEEALRTVFFQDVIRITNEAKREFVFLSLLQSQPSISWVAFGWPSGNFFGARKDADEGIRMVEVRHGPPSPYADLLRVDSYQPIVGDIEFLNRDLGSTAFRSTDQEWFQAADQGKAPIWTEYAQTPIGEQPGIAISSKLTVYGHYLGVMMVGIDLDRLARFLTALKVTRHGRAFILGPGNKVLSAGAIDGTTVGGWHDLASIADPLAGAIQRALAEDRIDLGNMPAPRNVAVMGAMADIDDYVTFTPLPFRHWVIVTVIPSEDILGDIPAATRRLYMLVVGLVALVSIAGALVTHRLISRPIGGIAEQMHQIQHFHLEGVIYRPSRLKELDDLSQAMRLMANGLSAFRKYLPADLVETLIREGIEAKPGGHTQALTVLFTDLAGFTGLTEAAPERIVEILGNHLELMSHVVHRHAGNVDKFIGDSVMAFWNAPKANPKHALSACKAALDCRDAFRRSADQMRALGASKVGLRIGVNSGQVLVGNIGSDDRLNYTAIGDAVNIASRLESLSKRYGTDILIGEATVAEAGDALVVRRVDKVAVYGRRGGITVYELLGTTETRATLGDLAWVERYDAGFERYLARDWSGAIALFEATEQQRGGDAPSRHMIVRCRGYLDQPPPADWDGTDMAESK
ncbi:MAG TPA: adenylate/guanylate cyclase domain-containing protein [Candidatus Cybelea sp.]|nr:adenylate/guanylate cyclase domain-containing protein [Candidatus Cybelea sp.]